MPIVFVSKTDPFAFIEVERLDEPVPQPGATGRDYDLRYRPHNPYAEDEPVVEEKPKKKLSLRRKKQPEPEPDPNEGWTLTTNVFLKREYRALDGMNAKELAITGRRN